MKKRFFCLLLSFVFVFSLYASASILGEKQIYGYTYETGDGLYLNLNRFLSDQEGVGNQTENYFEYIPGLNTKPVITLGKYVYGGEDINEIYSYLTGQGLNIRGGANGDFFSLETGVPNGHVVIDRKVISTDERTLSALGIREDGTAFIEDFAIITKMYHNGTETVIPFINKYLQKWGYYMYDSNYYTHITPISDGIYVTLRITDGSMMLGGILETEVVSVIGPGTEPDIENEEVSETNETESVEKTISEILIPKDCVIIALTPDSNPELWKVFENFSEGDKVEFTFNTNNDELWLEAQNILASEAGRIIKDGEYCGSEFGGASPRTAVGITEDGKMILYTVDGRQTGHSYGVRIPTLANRLLELGCVNALNLDGGGSTAISAVYGGTSDFSLINSPSDGRLRNDSTYIFFENLIPYSGEFSKLFLYPEKIWAKSGVKVNYITKASDEGFFPVEVPEDIFYSVEGDSYIDENGVIYASGDGVSTVKVKSGKTEAYSQLISIETPDYIKVTGKDGKEITAIKSEEGEETELNITAYYNKMEIISEDSAYEWKVEGNTGTVTDDGLFTMGKKSGKIIITAGELIKEIPVNYDYFSDISENWARHYINDLYEKGVVNGISRGDEFVFNPGNYVTKSEMATMLSRAMKLKTEKYEDIELPFCDIEEIADWALPHVKSLYGSGILNGTLTENGDIYFYPSEKVNRAEIFTVIGRILDINTDAVCPFSDREEFPDWAVPHIDALYEKGVINGYEDNLLKVYNNITRAEISKIIIKALFN